MMSASKRDILITKALTVFYKNGFHAVGMDKVASEVGISKTSIYKHFRSKEELIVAVIKYQDEIFTNWFVSYVEASSTDAKKRLFNMFDALEQWFETDDFCGCMFNKAIAEYQDIEDPIHIASREHKDNFLEYIKNTAKEAKLKKPELLASQLLTLIEGATAVAKMSGIDMAAANAKSAAKILIKTS
jgi:AcrR family transcriptional regulator